VAFTRSRALLRIVIVCAALAGAFFYRNAFATIRSLGWGAWPLALLLCVLAAAAWHGALLLARPSRAIRTHADEKAEMTAKASSARQEHDDREGHEEPER
jgi:hypothetical protein